jgi:valyl-tRNA synthetase
LEEANAEADTLVPITMGGGLFQVSAVGQEVDADAERARLTNEITRLDKEIGRAEKQLANGKFTSRAPAHLVEAERDKLARYKTERAALASQRDALSQP